MYIGLEVVINFHLVSHIHSVHEFADVREYGGENAPNIFAVLDVSSMTDIVPYNCVERLCEVFYVNICGFIV